jgi:hypothetical protein
MEMVGAFLIFSIGKGIEALDFFNNPGDIELLGARSFLPHLFEVGKGLGSLGKKGIHKPEGGVLEEHIGVQYGGYRRRGDDDPLAGEEEEIKDRLVGPGPQIEDQDVRVFFQGQKLPYQGPPLGKPQGCGAGDLVVPGDEAEPPDIRLGDNILKFDLGVVLERPYPLFWGMVSQDQVQIRGPQVQIRQDHLLARPGKDHG